VRLPRAQDLGRAARPDGDVADAADDEVADAAVAGGDRVDRRGADDAAAAAAAVAAEQRLCAADVLEPALA